MRRLLGLFLLLTACSEPQVELAIELQTDLVPGVEFSGIEIRLNADDIYQEIAADRRDDFSESPTLTNITRLSAVTDRLVTIQLVNIDGDLVASNSVLVDNRSSRIARVTIARSCVGVTCPGSSDSPSDIACLGGRCVDPKCTDGTQDVCPEPQCRAASECSASQSCLAPDCRVGVCVFFQGTACKTDEYCDSELGCTTNATSVCGSGCTDQNPCTADSCSVEGCVNQTLLDGTPCAGGTCQNGTCSDGCESLQCEDNNPCTTNACSAGSCLATPIADDTACPGGTCQSGSCTLGVSCSDTLQNQDETDVDCGGSLCPACPDGNRCIQPSDCVMGNCSAANLCESSCSNGRQDGDETDIDCGGARCNGCSAARGCSVNEDCLSMQCIFIVGTPECAPANCNDGIQSAVETGIDCGGDCAPCGFDCSAAVGVSEAECDALVDLYNFTGGGSWRNATGWFTLDPCSWFGITCANGGVTDITLNGNNLVGELPNSMGDFTSLTDLNLYINHLSGNIPEEIMMLPLAVLALQQNQFSGALSTKLGDMNTLRYLALGDNAFSGPIPAELGRLSGLAELYLAQNQLIGPLPNEIGGLTGCQVFTLSDNQLSGVVPNTIINIPGNTLVAMSGQTGCLTTLNATTDMWLMDRDPNWDDGC